MKWINFILLLLLIFCMGPELWGNDVILITLLLCFNYLLSLIQKDRKIKEYKEKLNIAVKVIKNE